MTSYFGPDFDRVARWLRRTLGLKFRVRTKADLRDENGDRYLGETEWGSASRGWIVTVNRSQDHDSAVHTLLHEAAHIEDFQANGYIEGHARQHRASWGRIYSRYYNQFFGALERGEV